MVTSKAISSQGLYILLCHAKRLSVTSSKFSRLGNPRILWKIPESQLLLACILFVSLVMHWLRSPLDLWRSPLSGQSDQGIGIHWILSTSTLAYIYKVYNICNMQYELPNIYTQCTTYNLYPDKVTWEMISNLSKLPSAFLQHFFYNK